MRALLSLFLIFMSGCTLHTKYGECIGFDQTKNEHFEYKVSTWNVVMAVIFAEFIFPPIVVLTSDLECPIAEKKGSK